MATEAEKIFAYRGYSNCMEQAAYHALANLIGKLGPRFGGIGQGFVQPLSSPHWLYEPRGAYLKVKIPKSGEAETIQVTVGAREGWKPVVSVASTSRDPVTIESIGDAQADVEQVKREIAKCLERLGL